MSDLTNKVAIVTGSSRGIGAAIARKLTADGVNIIVNYARNADAAANVVHDIEAAGGNAVAIQADLADVAQIELLFQAVASRFGRLDILVNNAGVSEYRPLETSDADFFAHIFDLNVRAVLLCTRQAAQLMNAGGRIVNISSSLTVSPTPNASVYAASKAALESLTAFLAVELGPRQITVNAVAPGVTETEMLTQVMPPDVLQGLIARTPLGRVGSVDDIAEVVAWLASDAARWVTGQTILANGGLR